ncbi:MAG: hypothetical protein R3A11_06250 [Bdellovibrionota bacterium]
MKKFFLFVLPLALFAVHWSCGNGPATTYLSALETNSSVSGTVCSVKVTLINTSPAVLALIHGVAQLQDQNKNEAVFDFSDQELAQSASLQTISAGTQVTVDVDLDFGGTGTQLPAQGIITFVAVSQEIFAHFVGSLDCS